MSSVPYVPPDTIKKVAATRGHKVSLPNFLFRGRTDKDGDVVAGALAVANFYGFLLKRLTLTTASPLNRLARLPGYSDSTGISAKLVRSTENTAI